MIFSPPFYENVQSAPGMEMGKAAGGMGWGVPRAGQHGMTLLRESGVVVYWPYFVSR